VFNGQLSNAHLMVSASSNRGHALQSFDALAVAGTLCLMARRRLRDALFP
jgi:hypothetical protein